MSHLFQRSEESEARAESRGGNGEGERGEGFSGFTRTQEQAQGWGPPARRKTRLNYPFDQVGANRKPLKFWAASNAVMHSSYFHTACTKLLTSAGLQNELEERKQAFFNAVYACYVINSSSVLTPDRADFWIEDCTRVYNYFPDVLGVLGDDSRRFFRAAADEIYYLTKDLVKRGTTHALEPLEQEMVTAIKIAAERKGLGRIPWCAFDAAEFCSPDVMPASERMAVMAVKSSILPSQPNMADAMFVDRKMQAAVAGAVTGGGDARAVISNPSKQGGYTV